VEDEEESGSNAEESWRPWVYAAYTLTLGAFVFAMQQLGSEISRLDGRITGTEVRLDQKVAEAAQNAREDRKELREAVDKVKDKLDDVIYVLREDKKK
jgi:hypothetical protein